jgi:hypothetical protein
MNMMLLGIGVEGSGGPHWLLWAAIGLIWATDGLLASWLWRRRRLRRE